MVVGLSLATNFACSVSSMFRFPQHRLFLRVAKLFDATSSLGTVVLKTQSVKFELWLSSTRAGLKSLEQEFGLALPHAFICPAYKWVSSPPFPFGQNTTHKPSSIARAKTKIYRASLNVHIILLGQTLFQEAGTCVVTAVISKSLSFIKKEHNRSPKSKQEALSSKNTSVKIRHLATVSDWSILLLGVGQYLSQLYPQLLNHARRLRYTNVTPSGLIIAKKNYREYLARMHLVWITTSLKHFQSFPDFIPPRS